MPSSLPDRLIRGSANAATLEHLLIEPVEMTQPGERQLMHWVLPPWQRPEVWDVERKRAFVEGIFLGLGTGFYVVHQADWDASGTKPMSGWLIDGQQRISAVRDFLSDELVIFGNMKWSSLSLGEQRSRFLNHNFPFVEIPYQRDERVLRELSDRLNFSGRVEHTAADRDRVLAAPLVPGMAQVDPGIYEAESLTDSIPALGEGEFYFFAPTMADALDGLFTRGPHHVFMPAWLAGHQIPMRGRFNDKSEFVDVHVAEHEILAHQARLQDDLVQVMEEASTDANPVLREQLQRILSAVRPKDSSAPRQRG